VAADFDGDGDDDLAVGAPGCDPGGVKQAGQVFLYEGTSTDLKPWLALSPAVMPGVANEKNAEFGWSLAAGKLDDGPADLAIGMPGAGAGSVLLYRGRKNNTPAAWRRVTQTGLGSNEDGDRFGDSLAIGRVDDDTHGDLVVGAPSEKPGNTAITRGWVYVFRGTADDVTAWKGLGHEGVDKTLGGSLGCAVAVGDFENKTGNGLVAGDYNFNGAAGVVLRWRYNDDDKSLFHEQVVDQATRGAFVDP
jgi:hypothetical protein